MIKLKKDILITCKLWLKILIFPLIFLEGFCLITIIQLMISNSSTLQNDIYTILKLMVMFLFASIGIVLIFILFDSIMNLISFIFVKIKNCIFYISIGKNDDIYLRDISKDYSPALVSLLCDKTIESYRDIPAVILNLKLKGYIDIIDNNNIIEYLKLKSADYNLLQHEKFVYYAIFSDKIIQKGAFLDLLKSDACNLGLIVTTKSSFKLTDLGISDMKEWKNFKKFLNHFTLVKDKNIDDLILYDRFLVYGIVLNSIPKIELMSLDSRLYNQYDILYENYTK